MPTLSQEAVMLDAFTTGLQISLFDFKSWSSPSFSQNNRSMLVVVEHMIVPDECYRKTILSIFSVGGISQKLLP